MKNRAWCAVLGVSACAASVSLTRPAVSTTVTTVLHGSSCQDYEPTQARVNSLTGIQNAGSTSNSYACPLVRQSPTTLTGLSSVTVNVYDNDPNSTITVAVRSINQFATAQYSMTGTTGPIAFTGAFSIQINGPSQSYTYGSYALGVTLPGIFDNVYNIIYTEN